MNPKEFFIFVAIAVLSALILFDIIGRAGGSSGRQSEGASQSVTFSERNRSTSDWGAQGVIQSPLAVGSDVRNDLQAEYDALCQSWLEFVELDKDGGLSDEEVAARVLLAYRSVEVLGLSRELMDLSEFLRINEIRINISGHPLLAITLKIIRENPEDAEEYRDSFLELCRSFGPEISLDDRQSLEAFAETLAKQGGDEEFMLFFEELETVNQGFGDEAFSSRSLAAVRSDPKSLHNVVTGMLAHFDSGNDQLDRKLEPVPIKAIQATAVKIGP